MAKNTSGQQTGSSPSTALCARMGEEYVTAAFEYRNLASCGGYGIFSRPPQGTELLILQAQAGEVCIGAICEQNQLPALAPGEILLRSQGGAQMKLCQDGSILLNGLKITPQGQIVAK